MKLKFLKSVFLALVFGSAQAGDFYVGAEGSYSLMEHKALKAENKIGKYSQGINIFMGKELDELYFLEVGTHYSKTSSMSINFFKKCLNGSNIMGGVSGCRQEFTYKEPYIRFISLIPYSVGEKTQLSAGVGISNVRMKYKISSIRIDQRINRLLDVSMGDRHYKKSRIIPHLALGFRHKVAQNWYFRFNASIKRTGKLIKEGDFEIKPKDRIDFTAGFLYEI